MNKRLKKKRGMLNKDVNKLQGVYVESKDLKNVSPIILENENSKMKARARYNRTSKMYNIAVRYNSREILLCTRESRNIKFFEFSTKQEVTDYILSKNRFILVENLKDMAS